MGTEIPPATTSDIAANWGEQAHPGDVFMWKDPGRGARHYVTIDADEYVRLPISNRTIPVSTFVDGELYGSVGWQNLHYVADTVERDDE
jgi:hypothetical protein